MASFEFVAISLIEELEKRNRLHTRVYRDKQDPFSLSDHAFVKRFRISKDIFSFLLERLKPSLPSHGLSPHLRVLVALRFYATGSLQKSVGNDIFISLSQASVSRCIHIVSKAIDNVLFQEYVKFPKTFEEQLEIKKKFLEKSEFPGVVGIIDSTYVALRSNEYLSKSYMNCKGFNSLKLQMVTDADLQILAMQSDSPGGTDDVNIWYQNEIRSVLSQQFSQQQQTHSSWLLGDNSYPLEPWLLTPFVNPNESEVIYNQKHHAARECMRKCKKLLKSRFCCLALHQPLYYAPPQVSHIINTCTVLHNLCIERNVPFYLSESDSEDDSEDSNKEKISKNDSKNAAIKSFSAIVNDDISALSEVVADSVRLQVVQSFL